MQTPSCLIRQAITDSLALKLMPYCLPSGSYGWRQSEEIFWISLFDSTVPVWMKLDMRRTHDFSETPLPISWLRQQDLLILLYCTVRSWIWFCLPLCSSSSSTGLGLKPFGNNGISFKRLIRAKHFVIITHRPSRLGQIESLRLKLMSGSETAGNVVSGGARGELLSAFCFFNQKNI